MQPDLSDEDIADLVNLTKRAIDDSRYPFFPEVRRWKELLAKLRPESVREPLPPPKGYAHRAPPPLKGRRAGR